MRHLDARSAGVAAACRAELQKQDADSHDDETHGARDTRGRGVGVPRIAELAKRAYRRGAERYNL